MKSAVRYRRRPLFSVAGLNRRRVVLLPSGERRAISPAMQAALGQMGAFRALEEHAAVSSRRLVGDALRGGLLLSEDEFIERASRAFVTPAPRLATIASSVLDRALRSYETNARAFGQTVRLVTAGSEDERRSAAVALAADKVDGRVARFALSAGAGAVRNALLLQTCGEALLLVEENTLCELRRPAGYRRGLATPRKLARAPVADPATAINLIAEFSAALGVPVVRGSAMEGDCDDDAIAALLAGRAQVDVACAAVSAAPAFLSLVRTGPLAMGCVALDHRKFLPPFPPLGTREGETFGVWLRAANSRSFTAHLPLAVSATAGPAQSSLFAGNDAVRLFSEDLARWVPSNLGTPERLMWLGARLREIGFLTAGEFRQRLIELRLAELARGLEASRALEQRETLRAFDREMTGPGILGEEDIASWRTYTENCGRLLEAWPAMTAAAVRLRHAGRLWPHAGPGAAPLRS